MSRAVSRYGSLILFLVGLPCLAQEEFSRSLDVHHFRGAIGPGNYLTVDGTYLLDHLDLCVGALADYSHDPLKMNLALGGTRDVVRHELFVDLLLSMGLFSFVQVEIALPLVLYMEGQGSDATARELAGSGLGDLLFSPKARILGGPGKMFGLAIVTALTLPTGNDESFMGEPSVTFTPKVVLELTLPPFRSALNVGYRLRDDIKLQDLQIGDELVYGLAAALRPLPWLEGLVEVYGSFSASHPFAQTNTSPVELLGALKFWPLPDLAIYMGGGAGLTEGYGTSQFRLIWGVKWGER